MYLAVKAQRGSKGIALFILNLNARGKWVVTVMPWLLSTRKEPQLPLYKNLGWPQGQSGWVWRRENLLSVLEVDPEAVRPVATYCVDYTILATL